MKGFILAGTNKVNSEGVIKRNHFIIHAIYPYCDSESTDLLTHKVQKQATVSDVIE